MNLQYAIMPQDYPVMVLSNNQENWVMILYESVMNEGAGNYLQKLVLSRLAWNSQGQPPAIVIDIGQVATTSKPC